MASVLESLLTLGRTRKEANQRRHRLYRSWTEVRELAVYVLAKFAPDCLVLARSLGDLIYD